MPARSTSIAGWPTATRVRPAGSVVCVSRWYRRWALPENEVERRLKRLQILCDGLLAARDEADDLHAYLLAAKIEDSRLCAQGMIAALR